MGFWDELKKPLYKHVSHHSRDAGRLGNALGWDWLEQEGNRNEKNPGRAVGKAAATAAAMYAGGMFGGGAGAGAGEAAGMFGAGDALSEVAQQQIAQQMAQQAAQEAAAQGVSTGGGMFANTMEAGMTDTGYTPSNLYQAIKNVSSENGTPLSSNLQNWGKQWVADAQNGSMLNRAQANLGGRGGANLAARLMQPQQQPQQSMQRAPMMKPPEQITADSGDPRLRELAMKFGISEEELKRLLMTKGMA